MHVGFVSLESPADSPGRGGIASYLRAVIPAFLEAGHRVTVIAKATGEDASLPSPQGISLVSVQLPNLHWYLRRVLPIDRSLLLPLREMEWSVGFYRAACRVHARDPFDVIEVNEAACELLAFRPPAPVVVRMHGSEYFFRQHTGERITWGVRAAHRLQLSALRRARLVTSPSKFHADLVAKELGPAIPPPLVVPNPVAPDLIERSKEHRLSTRDGVPTILYVGRLSTVKGTEHLLKAINDVVLPVLNARVLLAGPWQLDRPPESFGIIIGDDGTSPGIHWIGSVPQADLPCLYATSDVFVMPSQYETFGLSVLEAMTFGMPVVASAAGALTELVEDGVNGLLAPPHDAEALGLQLIAMLRNPGLRAVLGASARGRAREINSRGSGELAVRVLGTVARNAENGHAES